MTGPEIDGARAGRRVAVGLSLVLLGVAAAGGAAWLYASSDPDELELAALQVRQGLDAVACAFAAEPCEERDVARDLADRREYAILLGVAGVALSVFGVFATARAVAASAARPEPPR